MAGSAEQEHKFCFNQVFDSFKLCLTETKEVQMEHYVDGWRGLIKFLNTLGSVFGFIAKDAVLKVEILAGHLRGPSAAHYASVQSMVGFEVGGQLLDRTKRGGAHADSGCRTLLRLHRALRWLQLFLERLRHAGDDANTSALCSDAYERSLAPHHPWMVRKAAGLAFLVLPGRSAFFQAMNAGGAEQVEAMLDQALPLIAEVYDITEELYARHQLLDLP